MKKKILFNSSAGYKNVLGDILPILNICKDNFDCYVGIKNLEEDEIIENNVTYLKVDCSKYKYITYTAEYVVDSGTLNSTKKVFPNSKWINIWHGIPIKKMLLDEGLEPDKFVNFNRYYDTFISSSPYYTNILRKSFLYDGNIEEIGSPRYDSLFTQVDDKIYSELAIDKNKKVILFAPTFREPGEYKLPFNIDKFSTLYGDEYQLVVKVHYLNTISENSKFIDASNFANINELFKITDLLIADYSSLIFDYSLLKKPLLLFHHDIKEYSENRGTYFELSDYFSKEIVYTEDELFSKISTTSIVDYEEFTSTFLPYEDGNSSKRLKDLFLVDEQEYDMDEVVFIVNQVNEIGGVHNFIKTMSKNIKKKRNCKIIMIAAAEKNFNNRKDYIFECEDIDIVLSPQRNRDAIHKILENTKGTIISTQFYSHSYYQRLMKDKNVICMFHADVKYACNENPLFDWEMDAVKDGHIKNVKSFVMLTKGNEQYFKKLVDKNVRVHSIVNGIELAEKSSNLGGNFVFISRIEQEQKNVFGLIEIGKEIKRRNSSMIIDIYGDGPDKNEFLAQIKKFGLENNLIFKGYANDPLAVFETAKAHLMTSVMEGLPFTILETMSMGVPTIVYDTFLAAQDVIDNGENGYLVDFDDVVDFVDKMEIIDSDIEHLEMLSKNAIKKSYDFEYSSVIDQWFEEFDTITNIKSYHMQEHIIKSSISDKIKRKARNFINDSISSDYLLRPKKSGYLKKGLWLARTLLTKIYIKTPNFKKYHSKQLVPKYLTNDFIDPKEYNTIEYNDKISIIVPSYNSSKTVTNTVNSLLMQNYKNIEVLVIDDGSIDNTKDVIAKIKDERVKYYFKENEGLGPTRNYGVKQATGKFIFFIDADDTMPKNALVDLYYPAKFYNLEVVAGKTLRKNLFGNKARNFWMKKIFYRFDITNIDEKIDIITDTLSTNKLYNISIFNEKNIWFENVLYEDKLFTSIVYDKVDKIGYVNRHVYNWFVYGENTSITTHKTIDNLKARLSTIEKIFEYSEHRVMKTKLSDFLIAHDFKIYINEFCTYTTEEKEELYELIVDTMEDKWQYYSYKEAWRGSNYAYAAAIYNKDKEQFFKIAEVHSKKLKGEI